MLMRTPRRQSVVTTASGLKLGEKEESAIFSQAIGTALNPSRDCVEKILGGHACAPFKGTLRSQRHARAASRIISNVRSMSRFVVRKLMMQARIAKRPRKIAFDTYARPPRCTACTIRSFS